MEGTLELFDEVYHGARDEEEFHRIMAELGWIRGREYGTLDTPTSYPCLFRVEANLDGNYHNYANVYSYNQAQVLEVIHNLQELF